MLFSTVPRCPSPLLSKVVNPQIPCAIETDKEDEEADERRTAGMTLVEEMTVMDTEEDEVGVGSVDIDRVVVLMEDAMIKIVDVEIVVMIRMDITGVVMRITAKMMINAAVVAGLQRKLYITTMAKRIRKNHIKEYQAEREVFHLEGMIIPKQIDLKHHVRRTQTSGYSEIGILKLLF